MIRDSRHAVERYECPDCEGDGRRDRTIENPAGRACVTCDATGITAIDCPSCGREAVPIEKTTFAGGRIRCEPCGDRLLQELNRLRRA